MSNLLVVLVDGVAQLEFDRTKALPGPQLRYLDNMDAKMDAGISLDNQLVAQPDAGARAKFVAQTLATALAEGNDQLAIAMCTYLGGRHPGLKQVKIEIAGPGVTIDLDYENAYEKPAPAPQPIVFDPPRH